MIVWINILHTPHLFLRILFLVLALLRTIRHDEREFMVDDVCTWVYVSWAVTCKILAGDTW